MILVTKALFVALSYSRGEGGFVYNDDKVIRRPLRFQLCGLKESCNPEETAVVNTVKLNNYGVSIQQRKHMQLRRKTVFLQIHVRENFGAKNCWKQIPVQKHEASNVVNISR